MIILVSVVVIVSNYNAPKSQLRGWLNLPHSPMLPPPVADTLTEKC